MPIGVFVRRAAKARRIGKRVYKIRVLAVVNDHSRFDTGESASDIVLRQVKIENGRYRAHGHDSKHADKLGIGIA